MSARPPKRFWKLRRELSRVSQQLRDLIALPLEPIRQAAYDRRRMHVVRVHEGDCLGSDKVALLLIYQPSGLAQSVIRTCERLIHAGYAPLLVSNAPLDDSVLQRLRVVTWRVLVRPNFGYDFGGYRDGWWYLQRTQKPLDRLIVMNDSVWYPIQTDDQFIEDMEKLGGGFTGALLAEDRRSRQSKGIGRKPFISSFWLMFDRSVIESTAFRSFWEHYLCSNSKVRTIVRGERGLSAAMESAGYAPVAMFDRQKLDGLIAGLSRVDLMVALRQLVVLDSMQTKKIQRLLCEIKPDDTWEIQARECLLDATDGQNFLSSAPLLCLKSTFMAYIKKSKDPHNVAALHAFMAAMASGELRLVPEVAEELSRSIH
jgi:hypothetical protein